MKLVILPILLVFAAAGPASAIVSLGKSGQTFTLTGIGSNAANQGQSKMTWGTCVFDGTNTVCTLSGPFTGLGASGGTYSFVITYAGNGAFPLNAITNPGSDQFFAQATGNFDFVITLAETNGPTVSLYSFANFNFLFSGPTCTGVSALSCGVNQVGLTPNATIAGPITGTLDPAPFITPANVITASGYGGFPSIAPSTWVEIYGANLATNLGNPTSLGGPRSRTWATGDFVGNLAPTALGGTTATIAGKPAYIFYVSPSQANVQVPSGVDPGPQPLVVTTLGGSSSVYTVDVKAVEPGLLAIPAFVINGKQNVVALFSNTLTFVLPVTPVGVKAARARPGDTITLYGIGFGLVTPNIPAGQIVTQASTLNLDFKITFGGVPATVTYDGLGPANVGLYQFNVVVPNIAASDTVPVAFTLGGVPSLQSLVIAIQN
jgi:uncharacterized protein (TIGR03437 family)